MGDYIWHIWIMSHTFNFHMCYWDKMSNFNSKKSGSSLAKSSDTKSISKAVKDFTVTRSLILLLWWYCSLHLFQLHTLNWDELNPSSFILFLSLLCPLAFFSLFHCWISLCHGLSSLCLSNPETRCQTLNGKNSIYVKKKCIMHFSLQTWRLNYTTMQTLCHKHLTHTVHLLRMQIVTACGCIFISGAAWNTFKYLGW